MKEYIKERVLEETQYLIKSKSNLRKTAKHFNRPLTTVYLDVTKRLKILKPSKYKKVRKILDRNKARVRANIKKYAGRRVR